MIAGLIIRGSVSKSVVLRALGPSLVSSQIPAASVLADPVLSLHGPNGELIQRNDNWKDDQRSLIEGTPYQPTDDRESVIVTSLSPEAYTAIVTGKGRTTGIALVEVYDKGPPTGAQLANISTRGFVSAGDNVIIGGFILGENGQGSRRIFIRARGPSLASSGITSFLPDPVLELKNENGVTLLSNDDWQQSQETEISQTGLAPTNPRESALVTAVPAGHYFAILHGKNSDTGVAVVEIYGLQ